MMQNSYLDMCKYMYIWNKGFMKPYLLHVIYTDTFSVIYLL